MNQKPKTPPELLHFYVDKQSWHSVKIEVQNGYFVIGLSSELYLTKPKLDETNSNDDITADIPNKACWLLIIWNLKLRKNRWNIP